MLYKFPEPPTAVSSKTKSAGHEDYLGELRTWGWAENAHLRGAFDVDWTAPVQSMEVLVTPANLDKFNKATNNISIVNRRTTKRNAARLHTFYDDASIKSRTLHPNPWTVPDLRKANASKRESTLSKVKVAAKKTAKKANCFSSDEEGDHIKQRKGSTSTISTIVSSIAEITDAVSQMKWKMYFQRMDDRGRIWKAGWTNVGGRM
jgi:hypothetical protein